MSERSPLNLTSFLTGIETNQYGIVFDGPVVDFGLRSYAPFISARQDSDYQNRGEFLPPPNLLRALLSDKAMSNLSRSFEAIAAKHSQRFRGFDVHMNSLMDFDTNEIVLPWDILTYVTFDDIPCYMPVCVSFSHQIMRAKWDSDPVKNYQTKRTIIENQLFDIVCTPGGRDNIGIYGVSFPEQFSHGHTDRIFREFPTFIKGKDKHDWQCEKRKIDINGEPYAIYYFRGKAIDRKTFLKKIDDPACREYCEVIGSAWNENFQTMINVHKPGDPEKSTVAHRRILSEMGALV